MAQRRVVEQVGPSELPPAGDEQRDELKRRADDLAERAETIGLDGGRVDPSAFRVENELAQHFNELDVNDADPAYAYCWVQAGYAGRFIKMKLTEGWEVVQGDMPEASELRGMGADTTRRLGDVILMRCRRDRYALLQRREKDKRARMEEGVTGVLRELGEKYRGKGVIVHTDTSTMNEQTVKRMSNRAAAQRTAADQTEQWLREGRMPGAPAPAR